MALTTREPVQDSTETASERTFRARWRHVNNAPEANSMQTDVDLRPSPYPVQVCPTLYCDSMMSALHALN